MTKRGRVKYVPKTVLDELEKISNENGIPSGSPSMYKMVEYAKLGRRITMINDKFYMRDKQNMRRR